MIKARAVRDTIVHDNIVRIMQHIVCYIICMCTHMLHIKRARSETLPTPAQLPH